MSDDPAGDVDVESVLAARVEAFFAGDADLFAAAFFAGDADLFAGTFFAGDADLFAGTFFAGDADLFAAAFFAGDADLFSAAFFAGDADLFAAAFFAGDADATGCAARESRADDVAVVGVRGAGAFLPGDGLTGALPGDAAFAGALLPARAGAAVLFWADTACAPVGVEGSSTRSWSATADERVVDAGARRGRVLVPRASSST
ncbi:MAG: hypothetical protein ACRCYR_15390 [Phycicoccus sp.]